MADEVIKTEEEAKVEESADAEVLDAAIEKGEEETKDSGIDEAVKISEDFDKAMDSEEDDTAAKVEDTNEAGEEETAEKDTAKEDADVKTAEEKEIDEAVKVIEEEAKVESSKTVEQKQAEAAAKVVAADAKVAEEAKAKEAGTYVSDLKPDEWDEEVIKQDTERGQKALDDTKALQEQNTKLQSALDQQARQRTGDWLDRKFNELGKDFHAVLGKGEFEDLTPASVPYDNRIKVGNRMAAIQQAYVRAKKEVPSRNKFFSRAVTDLFKTEKNKAKTEAKTVKKLGERAGQVLGKGSQKASTLSAADGVMKIMSDFDNKLDDED